MSDITKDERIEVLRRRAANVNHADLIWEEFEITPNHEFHTSPWLPEHKDIVDEFCSIYMTDAQLYAHERGSKIVAAQSRGLTWMKKGKIRADTQTLFWAIPCICDLAQSPVIERGHIGVREGFPVSWRTPVFLPLNTELRLIQGDICFIVVEFELEAPQSNTQMSLLPEVDGT
ncbi:hypothetical protein Micbo1qcDRAFT_169697 [Microdochium bolleyi]|uniref:Uncharacterized protein n=1 Tax=Microdochium bolleyi TaxID=196109 RepID=A0A136IJA5_9PEZI|nr:hypothetical protein Micbo1qcDRAFT_169697 [Microdochium bolleyi]